MLNWHDSEEKKDYTTILPFIHLGQLPNVRLTVN
jgi:hypothetical protein